MHATLVRWIRPLLFLVSQVAVATAQTTWHVDVHATAPGNGTVQSPYASLQYAIERPTTVAGDKIVVAPGTYREIVDFRGKTLVVRSSAGASATVIDGAGLGWTIVTIGPGCGPGTRLVGFTLRGADPFDKPDGGGVLCDGSTAEVRECRFEDNGLAPSKVDRGAGVAAVDATVDVVRCRFTACRALSVGGAVSSKNSHVRVDHCSFHQNIGMYGGGGAVAAVHYGEVEVVRSSFTSNNSYFDAGGALFLEYGGKAQVRDCDFSDNRAWDEHAGGAIAIIGPDSTAVVERCVFARNFARWGGAIFSYMPFTVRDCSFAQNTSSSSANFARGAAVAGPGVVQRCTFWRNAVLFGGSGSSSGGAVDGCQLLNCTLVENSLGGTTNGSAASNSSLRNCIVWGNQPAGASLFQCGTTWSDVDVATPGTGNLASDPRFVSAGTGDLRLLAGSPCIDSGDPGSAPDPDGSRADMGAFPFHFEYGPAPQSYCQGKVNSEGCEPYVGHDGGPASVGGGLFVVRARGELANSMGLLVWSLHPAATPFQGGYLCVGKPLVRTPLQSSGSGTSGFPCSGVLSFPWTAAYLASNGLSPGTTVHCQFWARDAADPYGSSLSDALEFQLVP
jgi:hypothetical protein